ncbi:MAG: nucleotidyltransferase [Clostridium sp.]|nr:nucleotidyltransferase [Clostridium sp.]MCM1444379.1 nucleotidyltransferase [Candidatus Amulumruptor caecigallinarius]
MGSVGIICEYNPFHNGHLYHIKKIKEMFPNDTIILAMSGNFTQRGDVSIINKWDKTFIALNYGIDLVIELPFAFSTQSADIFSKGSIQILNSLNVEKLVFGSECGDIKKLYNLANLVINNNEYDLKVKEYLDKGINYPSAMSKAIKDLTGSTIKEPNDLLGFSYIKEIIKTNSKIKPFCIKRTNNFNSSSLNSNIVSAKAIREALKENKEINNYVPNLILKYIKNINIKDNYFNLLKYKILTSKDLGIYQTVDEGIENRIKKYIATANSLEELINLIKTKRYTYNKINRMFTHILCSFTKEEAKNLNNIEYIRIIGFNSKGKQYLNKIKKGINIPIITNFSSIKNDMLNLEFRSTCVYSSILKENNLIEDEYKNKPIIID